MREFNQKVEELRFRIKQLIEWIDKQLFFNPPINEYIRGYREALETMKEKLEKILG